MRLRLAPRVRDVHRAGTRLRERQGRHEDGRQGRPDEGQGHARRRARRARGEGLLPPQQAPADRLHELRREGPRARARPDQGREAPHLHRRPPRLREHGTHRPHQRRRDHEPDLPPALPHREDLSGRRARRGVARAAREGRGGRVARRGQGLARARAPDREEPAPQRDDARDHALRGPQPRGAPRLRARRAPGPPPRARPHRPGRSSATSRSAPTRRSLPRTSRSSTRPRRSTSRTRRPGTPRSRRRRRRSVKPVASARRPWRGRREEASPGRRGLSRSSSGHGLRRRRWRRWSRIRRGRRGRLWRRRLRRPAASRLRRRRWRRLRRPPRRGGGFGGGGGGYRPRPAGDRPYPPRNPDAADRPPPPGGPGPGPGAGGPPPRRYYE